jgi:hypothetical protein
MSKREGAERGVQRFVARRVHDPQLAADLTADGFVTAIESAGSSPESGSADCLERSRQVAPGRVGDSTN